MGFSRPSCATARLITSGQSCIAARRFIVVESVREVFEEKFVAAMAAAKMGDPMEEDTLEGPQARDDLRDELHDQVVRSMETGARFVNDFVRSDPRLPFGGVVESGHGRELSPYDILELA